MNVAIGSMNPIKIKAVKRAFIERTPEHVSFSEHEVDSGVPAQPHDEEIQTGAYNRAVAAQKAADADFGVGLEGGTVIYQDEPYEYGWCAIVDRDGNAQYAHSMGVPIPRVLYTMMVDEGLELGDALDKLLNQTNTKHREGFFGFATENIVTREHAFFDTVCAALSPLALKKYYDQE